MIILNKLMINNQFNNYDNRSRGLLYDDGRSSTGFTAQDPCIRKILSQQIEDDTK